MVGLVDETEGVEGEGTVSSRTIVTVLDPEHLEYRTGTPRAIESPNLNNAAAAKRIDDSIEWNPIENGIEPTTVERVLTMLQDAVSSQIRITSLV